MDEYTSDEITWTVDFDQVLQIINISDEYCLFSYVKSFQNYKNVSQWNKDSLMGFIFGNRDSHHIHTILFTSVSDVETTADYIAFTESSFFASMIAEFYRNNALFLLFLFFGKVSFIGLLLLQDVEYPLDPDVLSATVNFSLCDLRLYTSKDNLDKGILQFAEDQHIRNKKSEACLGVLALSTMQLDWNIKFDDSDSFKEMLTTVLAEEQLNVDYMYFLNNTHNFLLGADDVNDDFVEYMRGQGQQYYENIVNFVPLRPVNIEVNDVSEQRLVPVLRISKGLCKYINIRNLVTAFTLIPKSSPKLDALKDLRMSLCRTLFLVSRCILQFSNVKKQQFVDVDTYAFIVNENLITVCYPREADQSLLREYRLKLHKMFNVSMNHPVFRPSQSIVVQHNSLLRNPHQKIRNYKPVGDLFLVKGSYDYYHYLQGNIDDCGWGCAYRSFQTIWSWFNCQGYTDLPVPTHRQIQQSLVKYGDRDEKIVGSRQWLGSLELSYCLETMLGFESKILATNSGAELADNARKLATHFQQYGTPIMIGGGMLAHTILGVDFNSSTGECAFLVLDPHYTGEDAIHTVISKGWCGWKILNFWKKECFYNLLLPIPPSDVI
uniref:Ufm1-specific protease n=1 Tax=Syphacia muris TaxID=451379 RepID=A0A0N5ARH2_9BILA